MARSESPAEAAVPSSVLRGLGLLLLSTLGIGVRLDVQECDSACQAAFTDCMERCAGEGPCQDTCRNELSSCVAKCQADHRPPTPPK
ncbi:MAG TPA: hypothetical protein VHE30_17980 [Polyangiaceae bacterium]|nr:hypothetical protein [Polyangiaceae bacterium]